MKITKEAPHPFQMGFFYQRKFCVIFSTKKWVGQHFGRFFFKTIRSHWPPPPPLDGGAIVCLKKQTGARKMKSAKS
jgi:hypothetical protein